MKKKRRRKRYQGSMTPILWIAGILIVISGLGGLTYYLVKKLSKNDQVTTTSSEPIPSANPGDPPKVSPDLKKLIDELDKNDPRWRLKDLAERSKLDPAKNGASIAVTVAAQIPRPFIESVQNFETRIDPSEPIPEAEIQRLRNAMQPYQASAVQARKIASLPRGQFDLQINLKTPTDTVLDHAQSSRRCASVLVYDSELRAAERDGAGAILSATALFNLARYHADEPTIISQVVRIANRQLALAALERALTCANVSDESLTAIQQILETDGSAAIFRTALRGDRAMMHAMIVNVGKGETAWGQQFAGVKITDSEHVQYLRHINAMIDLADKPVEKNQEAWQTLANEIASAPSNVQQILPKPPQMRDVNGRATATIRAATIAVAAERYRRAKGDWPTELKQLTPTYLKILPIDPFSGGSFKFARQPNGITAYTPGPAPDQNGAFGSIGFSPEACQGFRLIDANLRR